MAQDRTRNPYMARWIKLCALGAGNYLDAPLLLASHAGVFRGARFSFLPKNHSRPQCLRVWECVCKLSAISPLHALKSSGSRLPKNRSHGLLLMGSCQKRKTAVLKTPAWEATLLPAINSVLFINSHITKSFTDQACTFKMAGYFPFFLFYRPQIVSQTLAILFEQE